MTTFIGRQRNVGIGKETVRGTAVPATAWFPAIEFSNDDKIVQAINESSLGVISDADNAEIVKKFSEAELTAKADNEIFGLIALATLGGEATPALVAGETVVYDHLFQLAQSAQHPTLTIGIEEPNATGASGLEYALCGVDNLEIVAEIEKFVQYTVSFVGNANGTTTHSPSYVEENVFLPQHCEVTLYADWTDLGTNTGGTVYPFKKVSISFAKNLEDDQVLGDITASDRLNKQFAIEGTLELLYNDRVLIDDVLLSDVAQAMKIKIANPAVLLGVASAPEIEIDLAKVKFTEIAREQANNDLVKQSVTFKGFYSIADSVQAEIRLRNLQASAY